MYLCQSMHMQIRRWLYLKGSIGPDEIGQVLPAEGRCGGACQAGCDLISYCRQELLRHTEKSLSFLCCLEYPHSTQAKAADSEMGGTNLNHVGSL